MDTLKSSSELAARIAAAEKTFDSNPKLSSLHTAVDSLVTAWPNERGLYNQLKRLARFIEATSAEISALQPTEVNGQFIPKATDELDAVVQATASATHRIMDAADVLMDLAGKLDATDSARAMEAINSIFEACSFQDITGQRVNKVVGLLRNIQERISNMVERTGAEEMATAPRASALLPQDPDQALLNGPALPGQGRSQSEIDALLADF
jgi:chemotaxis protein CheZ